MLGPRSTPLCLAPFSAAAGLCKDCPRGFTWGARERHPACQSPWRQNRMEGLPGSYFRTASQDSSPAYEEHLRGKLQSHRHHQELLLEKKENAGDECPQLSRTEVRVAAGLCPGNDVTEPDAPMSEHKSRDSLLSISP